MNNNENEKTNDPLTPMLEASAAIHEMYCNLVASGFKEYQALYMLGVMLSTQGNQNA